MNSLVDTHCHLAFENFDTNRAEIIDRAHANGVSAMVSIGCTLSDAQKTLQIAEEYENVFAAASIHPADIPEDFSVPFEQIKKLATHEKVVAVGETGLDLYRPENPPKKLQQSAFEQHFRLARSLEKPVIIHSRAAKEETLEMLRSFSGHSFVWHCFSEDMECAERVLALGGHISFTGIVTFPNRTDKHALSEIQQVAKNIPLDRLMIETDSPFLAPVPHRGKSCEPAFVKATAEYIAALRNMDFEEFSKATTENAAAFFGLPL